MGGRYQSYESEASIESQWYGALPSHWRLERTKYVYREFNERSVDGSEPLLSVSEYYGVKPRAQTIDDGEHLSRAESLEGYKRCEVGDLVMNIMLAWKTGLGVTEYDGIVSPAYSVFRLIVDGYPKFFHYLLRSPESVSMFKTRSSGVIDSRLRLYPESFGMLSIPLPPLDEQKTIAHFLDHETAKIDELIAKQERLIELLKEKRQAVISHAVTKGVNPDVPMKDSGVEWVGEVPEHWTVRPLKFDVSSIEQGWSPQCDNRPADSDEVGVMKVGCVNWGRFNPSENKALPVEVTPRLEYSLSAGDLLVSRANTKELVGSAAVVEDDHPNLLLCDKLYRLRLSRNLDALFGDN